MEKTRLLEKLFACPERVDLVEDVINRHTRQPQQVIRGELYLGQEPTGIVVVDLVDASRDLILRVTYRAIDTVTLRPVVILVFVVTVFTIISGCLFWGLYFVKIIVIFK